MAKKKHTLLWVAGAGVAGLAIYEFVYKPWAAGQPQSDLPNPILPGYAPGPVYTGTPILPGGQTTDPTGVPIPTPISQLTLPAPISITTIGAQYGGALGRCIAAKGNTWSPSKCQQRLNDLVNSFNLSAATIAKLQSATNPAASGAPAVAARIQLLQGALSSAQQGLAAAQAAGAADQVAAYTKAISDHMTDLAAAQQLYAQATASVVNSGAIAAYQGQMAANDTDYFNLTGDHLMTG